jgi:hypothetical protein
MLKKIVIVSAAAAVTSLTVAGVAYAQPVDAFSFDVPGTTHSVQGRILQQESGCHRSDVADIVPSGLNPACSGATAENLLNLGQWPPTMIASTSWETPESNWNRVSSTWRLGTFLYGAWRNARQSGG